MLDFVSTYSTELVIAGTLLGGVAAAMASDNPIRAHFVSGDNLKAGKTGSEGSKAPPSMIRFLPASMQKKINKWYEQAKMGGQALKLKSKAQSMNHWMSMLGKLALGLEIKDGETELDTYCDIVEAQGDIWPYMWEVNNVRSKDAVNVNGVPCRIYSSYGYLDLVRDEEVQNAAIEAAKEYASGNHGPRMLGGNTSILRKLEKELAQWLGREDALTCSGGYLACMSAVVALCRKGQVVIADDRCHASLRAGLKMCGAKVVFFKHNDFEDAEKKCKEFLKKPAAPGAPRQRGWMLIESVYSMDGDVGDLPKTAALARKYGLKVMVDEAHGLGVLGKTGRGIEEHFGMPIGSEVDVVVGTFSKSFSSVGGFIVTDARTVQYLHFYAPGNVFSAPMSAYHAGATIKALEKIKTRQDLITQVQENTVYFRRALENVQYPADYPQDLKFELEGDEATCVIPIIFPNDPIRMMAIADKLRRRGFQIAAVCAPACPVRRPRFRLTATSAYSKKDMDDFCAALRDCTVETPSMVPELLRN